MNLILKLYACCIPVKGFTRSLICDLQQMRYDFIPNALFEILTTHRSLTIEEIKKTFEHKHDKTIDEYIDLLQRKDYGFLCTPEDGVRFPELPLDWLSPGKITNCILDIPFKIDLDYNYIVDQLDYLGCEAVQLRLFFQPEWNKLKNVLNAFSRSRVRHIDILMEYNNNISKNMHQELFDAYPRIYFISLFNSPESKIEDSPGSNYCIHYIKKNISGPGTVVVSTLHSLYQIPVFLRNR